MTTYQLADFFGHLRDLLGDGLKADAKSALTDVAISFKDRPDQSIKDLIAQLAPPKAPGTKKSAAKKSAVDVPALINRIKAVQAGAEAADQVITTVETLKGPQLELVLKAFDQKSPKLVADRLKLAKCLVAPSAAPDATAQRSPAENGTPTEAHEPDAELVQTGVELYRRLWATTDISIYDVRTQFEPVLNYPKSVLEEITRQLRFTPDGSREDIGNRLLTNLERQKASQRDGELILNRL